MVKIDNLFNVVVKRFGIGFELERPLLEGFAFDLLKPLFEVPDDLFGVVCGKFFSEPTVFAVDQGDNSCSLWFFVKVVFIGDSLPPGVPLLVK